MREKNKQDMIEKLKVEETAKAISLVSSKLKGTVLNASTVTYCHAPVSRTHTLSTVGLYFVFHMHIGLFIEHCTAVTV